jgi:hypothetical protein
MVHAGIVDAEMTAVLRQMGIDLSVLPPVMSTEQLAPVVGVTPGALAQDRYRGCGIPYVKLGRRVRYLRADVARYLVTHRNGGDDGA